MPSKTKLMLFVLILALLCFPSLVLAEEAQGEVQLIIDFIDGHEVTIFLPEAADPAPLVTAVEGIIASRLQLQENWLDGEGGAVWLYSSPRMLPRFGLIKQAQWDLTPLLTAAGATGLDRLDTFLVVGLAGGLLNYDVSVSDQYGPVAISDVDGWEMWWGFGLTPDGEAPDLFTNIMLHLGWSPINLVPLLAPVVAALLLMLVGRRLGAVGLRRLSRVLSWLSLAVGMFTAFLMNWHGLLSYLGLATAGSWSAVALVALLLLFWTQVVLGLPASQFAARLAGQEWSLRAYLRRIGVLALVLSVLLLVGVVIGLVTAVLQRVSTLLAIVFILSAAAILLWQMHCITMHLIYRAKRWEDPTASQLVRELSDAMCVTTPSLFSISASKAQFANAYAVGLGIQRIYVTELLWDTLDAAGRRFIIAHELAHFKLGHIRPIYLGSLIPLWLVALSVASFAWSDALWLPLLPLAAAYVFYFLIALPRRRGYELAADQLALEVTGNADAAVSALLAVQEANRGLRTNPRTHPAMAARLEALRGASNPGWAEISNVRK